MFYFSLHIINTTRLQEFYGGELMQLHRNHHFVQEFLGHRIKSLVVANNLLTHGQINKVTFRHVDSIFLPAASKTNHFVNINYNLGCILKLSNNKIAFLTFCVGWR